MEGRWAAEANLPSHPRMPTTGRRSASVGGDEGRSIVSPSHEQDRLPAQAIFRRLVAGPGGHCAVKETALLQHTDCPRTLSSVRPRSARSASSRRSMGKASIIRLGVDQKRAKKTAKAYAAVS